jgi:hypothetical protein
MEPKDLWPEFALPLRSSLVLRYHRLWRIRTTGGTYGGVHQFEILYLHSFRQGVQIEVAFWYLKQFTLLWFTLTVKFLKISGTTFFSLITPPPPPHVWKLVDFLKDVIVSWYILNDKKINQNRSLYGKLLQISEGYLHLDSFQIIMKFRLKLKEPTRRCRCKYVSSIYCITHCFWHR